MNMYEIELKDSGTVMINLDAVKISQMLDEDVIAAHLGENLVLHLNKQSFLLALHASGGTFNMLQKKEDEPEEVVEEPKDDVEITK